MSGKKHTQNAPYIDDGRGLILGERFRLDVGSALPHVSPPGADAVAVTDQLSGADEYYALLCKPGVHVRQSAADTLMSKEPRNMRLPQASGTVMLNDGRHFFAIVFDRRNAVPILSRYPRGGVPEKDLIQTVLPAVIGAMVDMKARAVLHRAIRHDTILVDRGGEVILDQCLVNLPGEQQPMVYEPISSSLATEGARGEGVAADDCYALGVAALHLVTGEMPCKGMSAQEILTTKVTRGSYECLLQRRKFAAALQSLFAGTLTDEAIMRWSSDELKSWAAGSWDAPRPTIGGRRAIRPFLFRDRDYYSPELLAWALHTYPDDAMSCIEAGRLLKWTRNVLDDNTAADLIQTAALSGEATREGPGADRHEILARVCIALDPNGPLRFRDVVVTPSGIPGAIWTAFRTGNKDRIRTLNQLLSSPLLEEWSGMGSRAVRAALPGFVTSTIKSIMREEQKRGYGLERVLYEMLPRTPCIGESVLDAIVRSPAEMMLALNRRAEKNPQTGLEIGRHEAAFMAAQDKNIEKEVRALDARHTTKTAELVSLVEFYASVQRSHYRHPMPGMTRAFVAVLAPAASEIRSRLRRMVVEKKVESLAKRGDMAAMLEELDLNRTLEQDRAEFERAKDRLQRLDNLIAIVSANGPAQAILAKRRGYRYARLLSMSLAFLTGFYFTMIELL